LEHQHRAASLSAAVSLLLNPATSEHVNAVTAKIACKAQATNLICCQIHGIAAHLNNKRRQTSIRGVSRGLAQVRTLVNADAEDDAMVCQSLTDGAMMDSPHAL
jgi:hypothetical protein